MVRPIMSVCNHRHWNALDASALAKVIESPVVENMSYTDSDHDRTILYTSGLLRSLNRLHAALSVPEQNNVPTNLSNEDSQLLNQWRSVKDQLSERALISTLLPPGALKHLSNSLDELVFSCQKSGSPCGFTRKDITQWFHADFLGQYTLTC